MTVQHNALGDRSVTALESCEMMALLILHDQIWGGAGGLSPLCSHRFELAQAVR